MGTRHWLSLLTLSAFAAGTLLVGCGGSDKKSTTAADDVSEDSGDDESDDGDALIPEEKFEEIKNTFERKATTVARCFPDAVDAGEVDKNDRIKVTVGVEVQTNGTAKELEILGSSKRSKTLESCILESISRWEFPTLPKPVNYSYSFALQQL